MRMSFRATRRRLPVDTEVDADHGFPARRVEDVTGEKTGVSVDSLVGSDHAYIFVVPQKVRWMHVTLAGLEVTTWTTWRSGLRVTGVARGSSPLCLLESMSLKKDGALCLWMTAQCSVGV